MVPDRSKSEKRPTPPSLPGSSFPTVANMHFSNLVLGLVSALPLTFAAPTKEVTPPDYFLLKLEANALTRNKTYDGYFVRGL